MREDETRDKVNFPPHCRLLRDSREIGEGGWREALLSGGDHLSRVLSEYGELGFECLLEELRPQDIDGCSHCLKVGDERVYRLYVRPPDHE